MKLSAKSHDTQDTADVEEGYPMPLEVPPDDEINDDDDENLSEEERLAKEEIVAALLKHSYHLPHHNLYQDWWQYMTNNHPVFGMCLHHRYHPLDWKVRLISLMGSMLLGLALTNFCYLAFVFVDRSSEQTLLRGNQLVDLVTLNSTGNAQLDRAVQQVSVTTGNLVLWFVGAPVHGFYDSIAWSLMGCACCRFHSHDSLWARLCRTSGAFMVTFGVICLACLASFASLLRAAVEADEDVEITLVLDNSTTGMNLTDTSWWGGNYSEVMFGSNLTAGFFDNATQFTESDSTSSGGPSILDSHKLVQTEFQSLVQEQDFANYKFVVSFVVELLLNYIVFYPIVATVFFSGILSCCGRYPIFHGRQYEIEQLKLARKEAEEAAAMEPGVEVRLGGDKGDDTGVEEAPLVEKEPVQASSKKAVQKPTRQDTELLLAKDQSAKANKKAKRESAKGTTNNPPKRESTMTKQQQQRGESTKSFSKKQQGESTKSLNKSKPSSQKASSQKSLDKPAEETLEEKPATKATKKAKRESVKPPKVEEDKNPKKPKRESKSIPPKQQPEESLDQTKKAKRESNKDATTAKRESTKPKTSKSTKNNPTDPTAASSKPPVRKPVPPPPPPPPPSDPPKKKKKKRPSQAPKPKPSTD